MSTPSPAPPPGDGTPAGWTWERMDQAQPNPDANWGLEFVRVPQLRNLNVLADAGAGALTGVLDSRFPNHPGLSVVERLGAFADPNLGANDHGLHVTGTIAADFDDGVGVDGVNPFARTVAKRLGAGLGWGSNRVLTLPVGTSTSRRASCATVSWRCTRRRSPRSAAISASSPRAVAPAPLDLSLDTGEARTFTAKAYGFADPRGTPGDAGGTIASAGRYTAGGAPGTYQVVARSLVDRSIRRKVRVEIEQAEEEPDDTSPGVGIEFLSRGNVGIEMNATLVGV